MVQKTARDVIVIIILLSGVQVLHENPDQLITGTGLEGYTQVASMILLGLAIFFCWRVIRRITKKPATHLVGFATIAGLPGWMWLTDLYRLVTSLILHHI